MSECTTEVSTEPNKPKEKKHSRRPMFGRTAASPVRAFVDTHATPRTSKKAKIALAEVNPDIETDLVHKDGQVYSPGGTTSLQSNGGFGMLEFLTVKGLTPLKPQPETEKSTKTSHRLMTDSLVAAPTDHQKIFYKKITKAQYVANKKRITERCANGKAKRPRSQAKCLTADDADIHVILVNTLAQEYDLDKNQKYELNHLIAFGILGDTSQSADNLVLATSHCNTLMMFIENKVIQMLKSLSKDDSYIVLSGYATLDPDKPHLATEIVYRIECPELEFDLTVNFNPLANEKPCRTIQDLASALFTTALDLKRPIKQLIDDPGDAAATRTESESSSNDENLDPQAADKSQQPSTNLYYLSKDSF